MITIYKKQMIIIILSILTMSCSSNKPITDLSPKPNEGIITGNIKVFYNGKDVTEKTIILFNEKMWGKYSYSPDSSGIILTRLPLGECYIARLAYKNFFYNLPKEHSKFKINDNSEIYYIGDVFINWTGPKNKASAMFGLVGALADELVQDGSLNLYVENNLSKTIETINKRIHSKVDLKESLINAPKPDSK